MEAERNDRSDRKKWKEEKTGKGKWENTEDVKQEEKEREVKSNVNSEENTQKNEKWLQLWNKWK